MSEAEIAVMPGGTFERLVLEPLFFVGTLKNSQGAAIQKAFLEMVLSRRQMAESELTGRVQVPLQRYGAGGGRALPDAGEIVGELNGLKWRPVPSQPRFFDVLGSNGRVLFRVEIAGALAAGLANQLGRSTPEQQSLLRLQLAFPDLILRGSPDRDSEYTDQFGRTYDPNGPSCCICIPKLGRWH